MQTIQTYALSKAKNITDYLQPKRWPFIFWPAITDFFLLHSHSDTISRLLALIVRASCLPLLGREQANEWASARVSLYLSVCACICVINVKHMIVPHTMPTVSSPRAFDYQIQTVLLYWYTICSHQHQFYQSTHTGLLRSSNSILALLNWLNEILCVINFLLLSLVQFQILFLSVSISIYLLNNSNLVECQPI